MEIRATEKLRRQFKIDELKSVDENLFFCWHAKPIVINNHKCILFVNDITRYPVLLYNISDNLMLIQVEDLFYKALRACWKKEGFQEEVIETYISKANSFHYSKAVSKSVLNSMNQAQWLGENIDFDIIEDSVVQPSFSLEGSIFKLTWNNQRQTPRDALIIQLLLMMNKNSSNDIKDALHRTAFEVTIMLINQETQVWRKALVPAFYNFEQLHYVLQVLFGWENKNDHSFMVFDQGNLISLITHESVQVSEEIENTKLNYHHLINYQTGVNEYFSLFDDIRYMYDFELDYTHIIRVERTNITYDFDYAICIDGYGTTPKDINDIRPEIALIMGSNKFMNRNTIRSTKKVDLDIINKRLSEIDKEVRRY